MYLYRQRMFEEGRSFVIVDQGMGVVSWSSGRKKCLHGCITSAAAMLMLLSPPFGAQNFEQPNAASAWKAQHATIKGSSSIKGNLL